MERKIIFATKNEGKLSEIKKIINCISMTSANIDIDVVEDGESYIENAFKKARAICKISNMETLADDSGVEIAHLNGLPGKDAAIYLTDNTKYKERNAKILEMMKDAKDRSAKYVCHIVYVSPDGKELHTTASIKGKIAEKSEGTNGFAYDDIFIPDAFPDRTMAQLSLEEKISISHRTIALEKMKELLGL